MVRIGIYGASGYTGAELVRLLIGHPKANVRFATSESHAGARMSQLYPIPSDLTLQPAQEADPAAVDVVFCCLPHGETQEVVASALAAGARVIDLSADFRLADATVYRHWYGKEHTAPQLLGEAVYGLSELARPHLPAARLVANPGCYPTAVLLGLYPLYREGLVDGRPVVADAKSGVSGAGRAPSLKTHFVEVAENIAAYNVGRMHRHVAEMTAQIEQWGGDGSQLIFAPHLLPVRRGILATIYVPLRREATFQEIHDLYLAAYQGEPFVWLLPGGELASLAHTVGSNLCALSLSLAAPDMVIVCSSIDNLLKGASGQAVQNMNLMFGLEETLGLPVWSQR